jgi:hypothetical protein
MPNPKKRAAKAAGGKVDDKKESRAEAVADKKEARKDKAAERVPLRVPAGTSIVVRTGAAIEVDEPRFGDTVRGTVDYDVRVSDEVAIPAGSRAEISIVAMDHDEVGMRLKSISVGGRNVQTKSDFARVEGDKDGLGGVATAAIGATVGAVTGGVKGAAAGAGAGLGMRAIFGDDAEVPSGTRLAFDLREPLNLKR